jgi:hypothetical protein
MDQDLERRLTTNDAKSKQMRAKAFELRIDRANEALKNATSKEDIARYKNIKEASINTYHKYKQHF